MVTAATFDLVGTAQAKTNVAVEPFEDQTVGCKRPTQGKIDIGTEMQGELATILAKYEDLLVVKSDDKNPQYKVEGALTAFGQCASKKGAKKTNVSIEIRMVQTKTGNITLVYNAKASTSGSAKNLKRVTMAALTDIADRIERAISRDKNMIRVELDSGDTQKGLGPDVHLELVRRTASIPVE